MNTSNQNSGEHSSPRSDQHVKLFIPGPTEVRPEILDAQAQWMIGHRMPECADLIGSILLGTGARLEHVLINEVRGGTFFARIMLHMSNELCRKIVEIDARPSDSIVLALQHKCSIFVARSVYETVEDRTEILERVLRQQSEEEEDET